MEKVTGVGGVFFRAKDPETLAKWYADNLGVNPVPSDEHGAPWMTEAGVTVFAPFKLDTDYFGDPKNQWMINFRVADLDAMVAQLRGNGVAVEVADGDESYGRFARLYDPEGNAVELWQPADED